MKHIPIHIKVKLREGADRRSAELVFKTLRIGFPDNPVVVWQSAILDKNHVFGLADSNISHSYVGEAVTHWHWVDHLIRSQDAPLIILDTDVVFHSNALEYFPAINKDTILAGEYVPQHVDIFTGSIMVAKLHTALMYINPIVFRKAIQKCIFDTIPYSPNVASNITAVQPFFLAREGVLHYYDTLAHAFHFFNFLNTEIFGPQMLESFTHLHAGTWVNEIKRTRPEFGAALEAQHRAVYDNIENAKGLRAQQREYYRIQKALADELSNSLRPTIPAYTGDDSKPTQSNISIRE